MADITPAMVREDGANRIAKTGGQVGVALAVVRIGEWISTQAGWDGELPVDVRDGFVLILGIIGSYLTNRTRLRA